MLEIKSLNVLNDNVLVEAIKPTKRGGVVRGVSSDDKPEMGLVLRVGRGRTTDTGQLIPMVVEVGHTILFNPHTTTKFNIEGKNYYVLREEDVIGYQ